MAVSKFYGKPSNFPFIQKTSDQSDQDNPGGEVVIVKQGSSLNIGDLVFWTLGGRVDKHLNGSWYHARFAGVIVGGKNTDFQVAADSSMVGRAAGSAAGDYVLVQTKGIAWVGTDAAAGAKYYGQRVISGQTTAGKALALDGNLGSFMTEDAGFAIHGAASLVGKVFRTAGVIISGVLGTLLTVADTAALVGTTHQNKFGIYEARSTGGANETTAFGTEAATLAGVVLPAAPSVGTATYGAIIVGPTAADFIGGTTALDAAGVNAVFAQLVAKCRSLGYFIDTTAAAAGTAVRMMIEPV